MHSRKTFEAQRGSFTLLFALLSFLLLYILYHAGHYPVLRALDYKVTQRHHPLSYTVSKVANLYPMFYYCHSVQPWMLKHNPWFWPSPQMLTQDINSIHLYRSCYIYPLKYGTWVPTQKCLEHCSTWKTVKGHICHVLFLSVYLAVLPSLLISKLFSYLDIFCRQLRIYLVMMAAVVATIALLGSSVTYSRPRTQEVCDTNV